jgi:hypothetical protein
MHSDPATVYRVWLMPTHISAIRLFRSATSHPEQPGAATTSRHMATQHVHDRFRPACLAVALTTLRSGTADRRGAEGVPQFSCNDFCLTPIRSAGQCGDVSVG